MNLTGNAGVGMQENDVTGDPIGSLFVWRDNTCEPLLIGGSPAGRRPAGVSPDPGDRVIAADRGAEHARAWGWHVDLLVGDLDSLSPAEIAAASAAGTPSIIAPAAKDETDMELALARALDDGARTIIICAALGGRTDHLLANVLLLARPDLAGVDVIIADGPETVRLLRAGKHGRAEPAALELVGVAGDLLSLLPCGTDAVGVTTAGLHYPLCAETLFLGQARRGQQRLFEHPRARDAAAGPAAGDPHGRQPGGCDRSPSIAGSRIPG